VTHLPLMLGSGSEPRAVGQLGSRVSVSASFETFAVTAGAGEMS